MRKTAFIGFLLLSVVGVWGQDSVEQKVLAEVQAAVQQGGRITFSDLYNSDQFGPSEKAFLGQLYEIFFQVPRLLKEEYAKTRNIPTRRELSERFGIGVRSIELLLRVMESDPRIPSLFQRDPNTREIASLNFENIDRFMSTRGTELKLTGWESQPLPKFELASFTGDSLSKSDLSGKNVLIYFWFTGCPPCVKIAPSLAALHRKYSNSNFEVIGFNADQVLGLNTSDEQRNRYLNQHDLDFPNLHLDAAARRNFGNVNIFPTLFFVRANGSIFRHMINYQDPETLETVVSELVGSR